MNKWFKNEEDAIDYYNQAKASGKFLAARPVKVEGYEAGYIHNCPPGFTWCVSIERIDGDTYNTTNQSIF